MKKMLFAVAVLATLGLGSCTKTCGRCTSLGVKMCKGENGYDAYKATCVGSWVAE